MEKSCYILGSSDLQRKIIRLVLTGSAVTMVLNAQSINIYTHLEVWLMEN